MGTRKGDRGSVRTGGRLQVVDCPQVDIASRDIRARAKAGLSIRFLLPRSVEEFVRERKLYLG